jgi:hypothetical protein
MSESNKIPLPGEQDAKPRMPDFLKGDEWFPISVDGDFLDFDEPYRPPRYTMEREGVPFADVGELHIISGKPGNGKTGLMSQLEAATLGRQFGNTIAREVGHIVRNEQGDIVSGDDNRPIFQPRPTRILHIDTEQGKDDTIAFKNRVISMSGVDKEKAKDHFFILRLRDTELAQDRWRKILKAIYVVQPTDIFLDGMLDIVEDYNDQKECQPIIRKCMMLATYYDTSLWAVLHENPMVDKLVGTLGSIAQRKVSEIFVVIKVKQSELKSSERRDDLPDIYFRVKQVKARGKDVEDWLFRYETNVGGWGQPVEIGESSSVPAPQTESDEAILKAVVSALLEFMRPPQSEYFTNIVKELKKRMHCGDTKAKTYFTMANDASVFSLPVNNRYSLNTSQCDAILNDLPFAPPKP